MIRGVHLERLFNVGVESTPTHPSMSLFGCLFLQEVFIWSGLEPLPSGLIAPYVFPHHTTITLHSHHINIDGIY